MPHGDSLESPPLGFEASPQRSAACSGAKAYTKGGKKGGGRKEAISEGSEEKIISEDAPMLSRSRKKTTDSSERFRDRAGTRGDLDTAVQDSAAWPRSASSTFRGRPPKTPQQTAGFATAGCPWWSPFTAPRPQPGVVA